MFSIQDGWMLLKLKNSDYCNLRKRIKQMARFIVKSRRLLNSFNNSLIQHPKIRWSATLVILVAYIQNTHASSHIATYLIGFYLLHLLASYFTPQGVDEINEQQPVEAGLYSVDDQIMKQNQGREGIKPKENEDIVGLEHDGDKPLARSLNEIHIWERTTLAFALGLLCVYFKMLDVDVFWPLLLIYLIILAGFTLQKILKTMKKYKYGLADFKKQPI